MGSIKNVSRISLRYFSDIGLVKHPTKIETEITCTLQTDLSKLLESNKVVTTIADSYNMSN